MDTGRRYFTKPTGTRGQSTAGGAAGGDTHQPCPEEPFKRRRLTIMQEPTDSEMLDALEGCNSALPTYAHHYHNGPSNTSAVLNLSALKTTSVPSSAASDTSSTMKPEPADISQCRRSSLLAVAQVEQLTTRLPCKPAIPTVSPSRAPCTSARGVSLEVAGYGSLLTTSNQISQTGSEASCKRSSQSVTAGACQPLSTGLQDLFERSYRSKSQPAAGSRPASAMELTTCGVTAGPAAPGEPASAATAPVAFWNRAYWTLAAVGEGKDKQVAVGKFAAAATQAACQADMMSMTQKPGTSDLAASSEALQRALRQQQQSGRECYALPTSTSSAKQVVDLKHVSFLQSVGPSERTKDPTLAALLCSSEGLSSDSMHQEYGPTEDSDLCGFDIAEAAAAAAAAGSCLLSQGDEGMADSGLEVHSLDATPGCDQSSGMATMQLARAGQTPAPWVDDGNSASDATTTADDPAAARAGKDTEHTLESLEESHAHCLLSACMHECVVEALGVLSCTDGLPFRHSNGTGSLQMLLAYMLVVLHRADMLDKLQEQEPHTLLTMMWMAEAFCSQYRNRLPHVLYEYRFFSKGVPYADPEVQDVLKADVAAGVAIQKQILVNSGFNMWVEEPDMDAACQLLRQAGDGAHLEVLESAIADQARHHAQLLQQLLQQYEAAQQHDISSNVPLGRLSSEFGQEQQAKEPAAADKSGGDRGQAAFNRALRDRTNVKLPVQQPFEHDEALSVSPPSARTGSQAKLLQQKPAAAVKTTSNSSNMGPKQQLLRLTTKEQALGKQSRRRSNPGVENKSQVHAVAGKKATKKSSRQMAGTTLSRVWSKLLWGAPAGSEC